MILYEMDGFVLEKMDENDFNSLSLDFCTDDNINNFLKYSCYEYQQNKLVVAYKMYQVDKKDIILACMTLSNSSVLFSKKKPIKINNNDLWIHESPCIRVGYFAVSKAHANKGCGSYALFLLKKYLTEYYVSGCYFIILDSIPDVTNFYIKNKFDYINKSKKYKNDRLVPMYFALTN